MKSYVQLKCSVCQRTKDQLINVTRYQPDRCTITLACEGRLSPVGYVSNGSSILGVPPTGLTNWYQRGTQLISSSALNAEMLLDTSCGAKQQLVLAVKNQDTGPCVLELEAETQTAQDYRQYTFRRSGAFTVINGVEDGTGRKVLRYDITGATPDTVEVYVNGIRRTRGAGAEQFELYDGTPGSVVPPNTVLFNTQVTGSNVQVDIIVRKAASTSTISLNLDPVIDDDARVGLGSWEGVDYIQLIPSADEWHLFYLDFSEIVQPANDVRLKLKSVTVNSSTMPAQDVALLLSRAPHTQVDRERSVLVPFDALSSGGYLVVKLNGTVKSLMVTQSSTRELFPPMRVQRHNANSTIRAGLTGSDQAIALDNTIIIGPDQ